MAQYLDNAGLQELVKKTKEYARKSAKEAVVKAGPGETSGYGVDRTITGWNDATSAAIYSPIQITENQVTDLTTHLNEKAPLASPAFTGVPTAPTAAVGTNTTQIATTEFVTTAIGNIGEAMHYIGAINSESGLRTSGEAGDTYKVATAGTYLGYKCEVGDMIIANKDYSAALTSADVDVIQTNIDGAVSGPASATDGAFVLFDGTTGKLIKNSRVNPSSFKQIQSSAAFDGNVLKTIQKIEQNANGDISVTFQDIQTASTSHAGVVQLSSTSGDAEDVAATPKLATDLFTALDGKKQDNLVFDGSYDASTNKVATETTVSNAIEALNAVVDSSDGTNINVKVTEVGGKITDVNITKDATVNSGDVSTMITSAINALDVTAISVDTSATITSISEVDGKIAVSSSPISIKTSQITDFQAVLDGKADKMFPATAGNIATLDASGNLADAGYGIDHFKTKQSAVVDPSASGYGITFIDSISQNDNGVITPTKKTVQSASKSQSGLMSADDFTKLSQISTSANRVTVEEGVLKIDGTSAMGPISNNVIDGLFLEV
jgi:hypothetical protein